MPLPTDPVAAQDIAVFHGQGGDAAKLNYDVPLPSAHSGRRLVALDVKLQSSEWRETARGSGRKPVLSLQDEIDYTPGSDGRAAFDTVRAAEFVRARLTAAGASKVSRAALASGVTAARRTGSAAMIESHLVDGPAGVKPGPDPEGPTLEDEWLDALREGKLLKVSPKWGGGIVIEPVPIDPPATPALFLVEVYGISSFLSDYGLGRTVKTFSLLPGETSTISLKTWRSRESTRSEGSSIVDSFQSSSADRFSEAFQRETSDARQDSNRHTWSVGIEASGGVNLGIVQFGGGASASGSGEYHASRQQLAKTVSNVMREHTNESNAAREMNVTSTSELVEAEGEETVTERVIRNVNMRRTLNFVFRELNQKYVTRFHLRDIRVAYTNGKPGTWREAPLSGLRGLLEDVVVPGKVDEVAQQVLRHAAIVFDHQDLPVDVLEALVLSADGKTWQLHSPAQRTLPDASGQANREYAPPSDTLVYRCAPGPLGTQAGNRVDGVLLSEEEITLRTDSVIVEALLGQADALDPYAMLTQKADAEARELKNLRERLAHKVIADVGSGNGQADAYADMFRQEDVVRLALEHQNGDDG